MKFLSLKVILYLYKSATRPCLEYCCHVWAVSSSCYLEFLDKLEKLICRTVGPSPAASLERLVHHWNITTISLFYRYYVGICFSKLTELLPLPNSRVRSTRSSNTLLDFSVTIPRCYKNVYANSFFPRTAKLWNSLPTECFSLTYDLNYFKSRLSRLFFLWAFSNQFCYMIFIFFFLFFLQLHACSGCSVLHGVNRRSESQLKN